LITSGWGNLFFFIANYKTSHLYRVWTIL